MSIIKLKSGIKSQDFENDKGKKITLSFNVGDTDMYSAWIKKSKELSELSENLTDSEAIAKLKPLAQELIVMLFGKWKWRKVSRFCGKNVFAIMQIVKVFTGLITEGVNENVK